MVGIGKSIDPKSCLTSSTRSFEFGSTSSMRRCIDMANDTELNSKERAELVKQLFGSMMELSMRLISPCYDLCALCLSALAYCEVNLYFGLRAQSERVGEIIRINL